MPSATGTSESGDVSTAIVPAVTLTDTVTVSNTVVMTDAVISDAVISDAVITDTGVDALIPVVESETGAVQDAEHGEAEGDATPGAMPSTGASGANRGIAILLTVAAVLALLVGMSLWEKRGQVQ